MYIRYVDEFKRLKTIGYRFTKLYASNYICYRKDEVCIYKKGRGVEFGAFYENSHVLLEYLIQNEFVLNHKYNWLVLNTETLQIEEYNMHTHDISFTFKQMTDKEVQQHYNRYQRFNIKPETIECIKELFTNKLIMIVSE